MKCAFGDGLEEALRDQLVTGIKKEDTRRRMLANSKLTLQKVLDIIFVEKRVKKNSL